MSTSAHNHILPSNSLHNTYGHNHLHNHGHNHLHNHSHSQQPHHPKIMDITSAKMIGVSKTISASKNSMLCTKSSIAPSKTVKTTDIFKDGPNPTTWSKTVPHHDIKLRNGGIFPLDIGSSSTGFGGSGTTIHVNQPHVSIGGNPGEPMLSTVSGGVGATNGPHTIDVNGGTSFYGDKHIPGSSWGGVTYSYNF